MTEHEPDILQRLARLEARQDVAERLAERFAEESSADRQKLHQAIDELSNTLKAWQSSQKGYLAGVASAVGVLVWLVTVGWEWFMRHLK